jgi:hypothetical protein
VVTAAGDRVVPLVGLALQVLQATEGAQRKKRGLQVADRSLGLTLGLGPARPQSDSLNPVVAEQCQDLGVKQRLAAPAARHD